MRVTRTKRIRRPANLLEGEVNQFLQCIRAEYGRALESLDIQFLYLGGPDDQEEAWIVYETDVVTL